MKVAIVSYRKELIAPALKQLKIKIVKTNPDVAVCLGGEGTFLYGEQIYPGIPKLFLRHHDDCKNCKKHDFQGLFRLLKNRKYKLIKKAKIQANVKGKKLIGLNEINIHYQPPCALWFDIQIGNKLIPNIVGDGVIIATPYGSTGYYNSITRKKFKKGFGIAFNNTTKRMKSLIINENKPIKIKIKKHKGLVAADCNKKLIRVKKGDIIKVRKNGHAKIIRLNREKEKIYIGGRR